MNDLQRLADLRSEVREPDAATLRAAEARFLAATRSDHRTGRRAAIGRRPALALALPMAVGCTVAITAVIGANTAAPPPVVALAAVDVLDRAAQAARQDTELSPRPDQFIVTESVSILLVQDSDGSPQLRIPRTVWLPVDGRRDGAVSSPPTAITVLPGGQPLLGSPADTTCVPSFELPADGRYDYAHLTSLPTEPAAMLAVLEDGPYGNPSAANRAMTAAGDLLRDAYLPPAQRAAIFQALGLVPGVSVVEDATDAAGRHGIAVAMVDPEWGTRSEIIFDTGTYRYLGERSVVVDPSRFEAASSELNEPGSEPLVLPVDTVLENSAQLSIGLADSAPDTAPTGPNCG